MQVVPKWILYVSIALQDFRMYNTYYRQKRNNQLVTGASWTSDNVKRLRHIKCPS